MGGMAAPWKSGAINLLDAFDIGHWRRVFGVSEARLVELVRQHGNSAARIRQALGQPAALLMTGRRGR